MTLFLTYLSAGGILFALTFGATWIMRGTRSRRVEKAALEVATHMARLQDARGRGDTRDMHTATASLIAARTAQLRVERGQ